MTAEDPIAAPIRLTLDPEAPEAGAAFTLAAEIDATALPGAMHLVILDAAGVERARAVLRETETGLSAGPVQLTAPLAAGSQMWLARLVAATDDPDAPAPVEQAFALPLRAHPVGVVVWGLPAALSQGEAFTFHVGLKCPCGCASAGWGFEVRDEEGQVRAEGTVGADPWPGTEGLCFAEVALTAPQDEGTGTWTVAAIPPDHPAPHAPGQAPLRLVTRRVPDVAITVVVTDAATGAPVPRAKVVVHPYRALSDENGIAVLRVPKGHYRVQVSGLKYFPATTEGDVTEDTTITADLEIDREFTDADAWA